MARSVVDTERIAAAAGDLHRLADTISSSLSELRGRLTGLGSTGARESWRVEFQVCECVATDGYSAPGPAKFADHFVR